MRRILIEHARKRGRHKRGPFAAAAMVTLALLADVAYVGWQRSQAASAATLVAAPAGATTLSTRQVWAGRGADQYGSVSPDGRYVSFGDRESGNLGVHDVVTGDNRIVTSGGSYANDFDTYNYAEMSIWSPDGSQLAYTRFFKNFYELRITDVDGLDSRLLYRNPSVYYPAPDGWTPDGQHLLVRFLSDGGNQIGLLSVRDGSLRILKSFGQQAPRAWLGLSPDGAYFAYSVAPDEASRNRDLYLMASDGSREVRVTETQANESALGWAPDGSLLFKSDRTGRHALWTIGVVDGTPKGPAVMLWGDLGDVRAMGTTREGALHYLREPDRIGAFAAAWDPETAEAVGAPEAMAASKLGRSGRMGLAHQLGRRTHVQYPGGLLRRSGDRMIGRSSS